MEHEVIVLLACAVLAVVAVGRLRLPPIVGYLVAGMTIGPYAFDLIDNRAVLGVLGEVGVAFMLFAIGLEFSLPQLWQLRRVVFGLGAAQVAIGTLSGGLLALAFGAPAPAAFVIGGVAAMSSTAIVAKQLAEQAELQARHGRIALAILLFQDLAAVLFLVSIPLLSGDSAQPFGQALAVVALQALAVIAAVVVVGRYGLRPLFFFVSAQRSRELFTLVVLLVSLCAAWLTAAVGLSPVLGAFIAGMLLAETEYRHQIDADLRPFKDVLLGLFFLTIGMQFDWHALPQGWLWTLVLTGGIVFGKGLVVAALAWWWQRDALVALRGGIVLAQGGEFGFALVALALAEGVLSSAHAQPILGALFLSMLCAPPLIRHNHACATALLPRREVNTVESDTNEITAALDDIAGHVVIAGYGRVGGQLGVLLKDSAVDFAAVDRDARRCREAWEQGLKVFYGDAAQSAVLQALGIARCRALVVSFADDQTALRVVRDARALCPQLPILVRTPDDRHLEALLAAGATDVVPETLETSLMLTAIVLEQVGVGDAEVEQRLRAVRDSRYIALRDPA